MAGRSRGKPERAALSCLALAAALLSGCATPRLQFQATPEAPEVKLAEAGISLTIRLNSWAGSPGSLAAYYTPLEVQISSQREDDVEIRLRDFALVDEDRNQYPAIPAAEVAQSLFGLAPEPAGRPDRFTRSEARRLVAGAGPWWAGSAWSPRFPSPPWYPYESPLYPWDDPFAYPAYAARTAYDVVSLALREGRLLPGARLEGFLYFRLATRSASLLTLSWKPTRSDGTPLAAFVAPLRVAR